MGIGLKCAPFYWQNRNRVILLLRLFRPNPVAVAVLAAWSLTGSLAAAPVPLAQEGVRCDSPGAPKHLIEPIGADAGNAPADGATRIEAERVAGQSDVRVRAEGDVVVSRDDQVIRADWIDYHQPQETVRAGEASPWSKATAASAEKR